MLVGLKLHYGNDYRCCYIIFFFKQKTAYEMRISDWSSDVCSSDLQSQPESSLLIRAASISITAAPALPDRSISPITAGCTVLGGCAAKTFPRSGSRQACAQPGVRPTICPKGHVATP